MGIWYISFALHEYIHDRHSKEYELQPTWIRLLWSGDGLVVRKCCKINYFAPGICIVSTRWSWRKWRRIIRVKCWRNLRLIQSSINLRFEFIQVGTIIFAVISKYSSSNVFFTIWTLIRFITADHQMFADCGWRTFFVTKRTRNNLSCIFVLFKKINRIIMS